MEVGISLQEITELRKFGNALLQYSNVSLIIEEVSSLIRQRLAPQVMSVFLFSKDGFLERYEICGIDKRGNSIRNSWLEKEKYKPGQSFSGKSALGKPYGEPHWSNELDAQSNDFQYGKEYCEKLGFLRCGISVPLNGTRRTFGTIEVINRVGLSTHRASPDLTYSESDICWLTIVGAHVAAAISRLRKKEEDKIFATISKVLADPALENQPVHSTSRSVYRVVSDKLVDYLTPYKACIVRLSFDGKNISVTDKSHSDGDEKGWIHRVDESRTTGEKIVGKVFQSGKYEIVENIEKRESEFTNLKWVEDQNLQSFICFPLIILGKVIGTISLFTGYVHEFSESDIEFLENVSFLLAAFWARSRKVKNAELLEETSELAKTHSAEICADMQENTDPDFSHEPYVTAGDVEALIEEAITSGVAEEDLENLRSHLEELKEGSKLMDSVPKIFYKELSDENKTRQDGGKEVVISTAPLSENMEDDFEGLSPAAVGKFYSSQHESTDI